MERERREKVQGRVLSVLSHVLLTTGRGLERQARVRVSWLLLLAGGLAAAGPALSQ